MSTTTVRRMIRRACNELAATHPEFANVHFAPHDFRRLFATELVNNGLPIHIGAALLGHLEPATTHGYVAVFDEDVIRHYQQFLAAAGQPARTRSTGPPTGQEWTEFEDHFDKRNVELGTCGRPYGTPCAARARLHPLPDAPCQPGCSAGWPSSKPICRRARARESGGLAR